MECQLYEHRDFCPYSLLCGPCLTLRRCSVCSCWVGKERASESEMADGEHRADGFTVTLCLHSGRKFSQVGSSKIECHWSSFGCGIWVPSSGRREEEKKNSFCMQHRTHPKHSPEIAVCLRGSPISVLGFRPVLFFRRQTLQMARPRHPPCWAFRVSKLLSFPRSEVP